MIWTLIALAITFFVLKKVAFKPIQKTIDDRRDRIREAVEEADNARNEARELLEQNRAILAEARSESGKILADAVSDAHARARVGWMPSRDDGARWLASLAHPGDVVLTVGAGDVDAAVPVLLEALA